MNKTQRETEPLVVLHRIPTANELEEIRGFMKRYKQANQKAKWREIRRAAQKEFETSIYRRPHKREKALMQKKLENINTKPV